MKFRNGQIEKGLRKGIVGIFGISPIIYAAILMPFIENEE